MRPALEPERRTLLLREVPDSVDEAFIKTFVEGVIQETKAKAKAKDGDAADKTTCVIKSATKETSA